MNTPKGPAGFFGQSSPKIWCPSRPYTDIEDKSAEVLELFQQAVNGPAQFPIAAYICCRAETGSVFLPPGSVLALTLDPEAKEFTLVLAEPGPESPHLVGRQDEASEAVYRAFPVIRVVLGDVGTEMPVFVEISEIRRP